VNISGLRQRRRELCDELATLQVELRKLLTPETRRACELLERRRQLRGWLAYVERRLRGGF